jgi:hypothetical protein
MAPPNRGGLNSTHFRGTHVPVEEPSTASQADIDELAYLQTRMLDKRREPMHAWASYVLAGKIPSKVILRQVA